MTPTCLTSQLSAMGVRPASGNPMGRRLPSGIQALDQFLDGGLPVGAVTEWGAPLGRGGREVLLAWLTQLGKPSVAGGSEEAPAWALWAYSRAHLAIYPPAWQARGVPLARVRFAAVAAPLAELRPIFLEPLFRFIVIDGPRSFSDEDCAFVARQARLNDLIVIVARDGFLGPEAPMSRSNVWARLRLNCWFDDLSRQYRLQVVRGMSPRQLVLPEDALRRGVH